MHWSYKRRRQILNYQQERNGGKRLNEHIAHRLYMMAEDQRKLDCRTRPVYQFAFTSPHHEFPTNTRNPINLPENVFDFNHKRHHTNFKLETLRWKSNKAVKEQAAHRLQSIPTQCQIPQEKVRQRLLPTQCIALPPGSL